MVAAPCPTSCKLREHCIQRDAQLIFSIRARGHHRSKVTTEGVLKKNTPMGQILPHESPSARYATAQTTASRAASRCFPEVATFFFARLYAVPPLPSPPCPTRDFFLFQVAFSLSALLGFAACPRNVPFARCARNQKSHDEGIGAVHCPIRGLIGMEIFLCSLRFLTPSLERCNLFLGIYRGLRGKKVSRGHKVPTRGKAAGCFWKRKEGNRVSLPQSQGRGSLSSSCCPPSLVCPRLSQPLGAMSRQHCFEQAESRCQSCLSESQSPGVISRFPLPLHPNAKKKKNLLFRLIYEGMVRLPVKRHLNPDQ